MIEALTFRGVSRRPSIAVAGRTKNSPVLWSKPSPGSCNKGKTLDTENLIKTERIVLVEQRAYL